MKLLGRYIKTYRTGFASALAFLMLETVGDLLQPTIMAKIIDVGVAERDMAYVGTRGVLMLGVTAFGAMAAVARNIISSNVSQRFGAQMRSELFLKVQSLSHENLDRFDTASLVTRLTNDVTHVQGFVHGMMRIFVKAPMLCIGSILMAVLLNPRMASLLLLIIPIIGGLIFLSVRIGYPFFQQVQQRLDGINRVMREYLSGVRVVKAFHRFDYETHRFEGANQDLASASTRAMRVMAVFSPVITLTVNIGIAAVLYLGGLRVHAGSMQVGQVIAFINYMTQILFSLMMISFVFNMYVRAKASAERIEAVLTEQSALMAPSVPVQIPEGLIDIRFDQVRFRYAGAMGEPVLKDISFQCRAGEIIGIIGSTGSGKTTLVHMLPRFYDAESGFIQLNGIDLRRMDPRDLREHIAIVPQKTVLFTGTIGENIRWGRAGLDQDGVERAARIAQAHDFISASKEGYETQLGQGGINLSGGQKQRVAIARALARHPQVLILDDCTSAVDSITEAKIRKGLKEYAQPLTTFIIAQRITSIMGADQILVLDNGMLVGAGSHEALISDCPVYQEIYQSQIGGREATYVSPKF